MTDLKTFKTKTEKELRIHEVEIIKNIPFNPKIIYSENISIPNTLRKYYNANEYGHNVFKKSRIWATHPFDFNDPFDCAFQLWDLERFPFNEAKFFLNKFLPRGFSSSSDIQTTRRTFFELALRFIGIYCLNNNKNDELFWGYYTNHKGFSIIFDANVLSADLGMIPFRLEYKKISKEDCLELIPSELVDFNIFPKILKSTTLKKLDWAHENEWRYVFTDIDLGNTNRERKFSFDAIKEIILGYKYLPSYNYERLDKWTKKYIFDGKLESNYSFQILKLLFQHPEITLKQVVLRENFSITHQIIFIKNIVDNQVTIERAQ